MVLQLYKGVKSVLEGVCGMKICIKVGGSFFAQTSTCSSSSASASSASPSVIPQSESGSDWASLEVVLEVESVVGAGGVMLAPELVRMGSDRAAVMIMLGMGIVGGAG
jgi:hypothetical protein